jgi:flagellar M-ring protein FliF
MVKLKPGRTLSQSQVQGIVHLISSSVEGLSPQEVTVIDNRGGLLTRPTQGVSGELNNNQLELQRSFEKEIESRVVNILEPITGKDKIKARAFATLDFTRTEKTEEKYDPNGQVVRSEQKNQEKSTAGSLPSGVPGTTSNLPNKKSSAVASTGSTLQKQSEVVNYEVSKMVSRVISPLQELKRLSVAVVVDGSYGTVPGSKTKKYVPRTAEEMKRYEDLAKNAVGFSQERGDEVRVVNMPFEISPQEDYAEKDRDYWPIILSAARYAGPLIAFLLIFLFVLKPLTKQLLTPSLPQGQVASLALPQTVSEIENRLEAPKPKSAPKALTMGDDVRHWATENPDQAASLIKSWTEES